MADPQQCWIGTEPHPLRPEHTHPYQPTMNMTRRCTCGCRKFTLTIGGPIGVHVACERCGRDNYGATLYERGREDGRPEVKPHGSAVPF